MNSFLAISCFFICFTTTIAFPKNGTKLWSHTFKLGEKTYFVDLNEVSFDDAVIFCKDNNLQLVAIENEIENTNLYNHLDSLGIINSGLWTSGTKLAFSEEWVWLTSGEVITFTDWNFEPTYKNNNEYCLAVVPSIHDPSHFWINDNCEVLAFPICQSVSSN
ncbi:unnamed protein product [Psylliodes chrysocephalus]|uniref:C-type lectin domain-containing protein n=1 Tax=Psylliodes chrysocephalus TaxID=3402493 RepID=A0A9P0GAL4_9CUCU|nr:unnamed protein product [Psylliodes chrysocephala]